ncbi:hypothetical protein [Ensifer adhaerens]|uniref:hypothetical protein n=1 Tax=Ensifer adhaerens TaxID=106592 RepID=UPI001C4E235C|nr:hypothetical protein [Ensifer adhaerens]MBW0366148.1 hypothetical protein [Ensifer adhaerens]UCM19957.1 hypothetical protein LDL63_19475 [Ensifer adhaerens]
MIVVSFSKQSKSRNALYGLLLFTPLFGGTTVALAQEKCFSDSKKEIVKWMDANDDELVSYANQMEQARKEGKNPREVWVKYKGIDMPLSAAYDTVHASYGRASRGVVEQSVEKARECAKDVQLPRASYDVAREYLGLTTVLPEAATRVDFAELQAGNVFGGADALVPKALEDARKAAEKAAEDLANASGKALDDARKAADQAIEDLKRVADPSTWKL